MNGIVQRLVEKTGLPEDKASAAVDAVVGFLKEKLPGPIASQIDNLLAGGGGLGDKLGGVAKGLGGMLLADHRRCERKTRPIRAG